MRNICLADQVYIFDCIEFNPRFRYGDVAADIDFLAMDLDFHGLRDLSRHLVERLAQATGDPELLVMLDFYKCYRAYVRGKIAAFSARDPELPPEARAAGRADARAYFSLAGEYAARGAVGGIIPGGSLRFSLGNMDSLFLKKSTFIERFKRGHSLRFHMSLILLATIGCGLLATRMMLALGLKNVMVRYPLAVVAAYLSFFLGVKLWLKFVVPLTSLRSKTSSNSLDIFTNISGSGSSGGSSGSAGGFKGGGGGFGGGGASGSFAEVPAALAESSTEAASGGHGYGWRGGWSGRGRGGRGGFKPGPGQGLSSSGGAGAHCRGGPGSGALSDFRGAHHPFRGGLSGYPRRGVGAWGAADGERRLARERLHGDLDTPGRHPFTGAPGRISHAPFLSGSDATF